MEENLEKLILEEARNSSLPCVINGKVVSYLCIWCSNTIEPKDLTKHYLKEHYKVQTNEDI